MTDKAWEGVDWDGHRLPEIGSRWLGTGIIRGYLVEVVSLASWRWPGAFEVKCFGPGWPLEGDLTHMAPEAFTDGTLKEVAA